MNLSSSLKKIIVEIICLLYILLFVYAAVSKLIDFHDFVIQIGKSPIFTEYAFIAAIAVIAVEICITVLLSIPRVRFFGLFASLSLMTMFCVYIGILLLWSPYVPCSCGGVLSTLGWEEHLVFNLAFVLLAVLGIFMLKTDGEINSVIAVPNRSCSLTYLLPATIVLSAALVIGLYIISEEQVHRNNGFVRRYPHHPATMLKGMKIPYNSYYIAGYRDGRFYLGNLTAPSHVLSIDTMLLHTNSHKITIEQTKGALFVAPRLYVTPDHFYIADGSTSVIYKGDVNNWKAEKIWEGTQDYLQFRPLSGDRFLVSGIDEKTNTMALGLITGKGGLSYFPSVLPKTGDGIFENDGVLLSNPSDEKALYVYYYKNRYVSVSDDLTNVIISKTIDTLASSSITIAKEDHGTRHTIGGHAEMLQVQAATSGHYLFVKSRRLGKFEDAEMLQEASIIDVYDVAQNTYEFSFYLYNYENEAIKTFEVHGDLLIGLSENHLVLYRLNDYYFKKLL